MKKAVNGPSGDPRGAVDKALEVLAMLARPGRPHRLADLAQACALPKPTTHRMLQTFAEAGFAVSAGSGRYDVGPRLLGLSAAALSGNQAIRPVLADLRRRTGHTVHYAVRHADRAVYVEKLEPDQAYRLNTRPGGEVPLHCTGVGRAMLSKLPAGEVAALLDGPPLRALTSKTLTDPAAIRRELATVDTLGYVVDDEQHEQHVRCVAAPVVAGDGSVVGAVSVSGLTFTLQPDSFATLGPLVAEAANRLSATLGGAPVHLVSDED
ncbi:IclR family transcriptional regulator [Amycolatopsis jiangsuensis]|uniref:IclR family acetate operon transcriptional repressor n=1 Tax=Amycolatopsis jiangsuensis TaxID=1181879 RepID=A0A840IPD9_9PSEU|nr:IclR family transcriptional regulator [Amycolatopsis jiangsuensis]MBB4684236.1 IclR family acetate operon transcriptional repressor [Amycolatopsis jiangsuensis]